MVTFNPVEVSKNIQQYGGFIPGIRPGKPTSDYLAKISSRLTLFGGLFLALLATLPGLIAGLVGTNIMALTATGVLISVSVALETSKQLESQMLMRHYKGFLKYGRQQDELSISWPSRCRERHTGRGCL